jgi:hypothetical protein
MRSLHTPLAVLVALAVMASSSPLDRDNTIKGYGFAPPRIAIPAVVPVAHDMSKITFVDVSEFGNSRSSSQVMAISTTIPLASHFWTGS